jgi:hypothetical protein
LFNYFSTVLIVLLSFVLACTSPQPGEKKTGLLSNLISNTDNEVKGIKEIVGFYGGQCEYGVEKTFQVGDENEKTFWIKFSKNASLDSFPERAELPGSNIAYLFYKNLGKEKNNYDKIRSELVFANGRRMAFKYTPEQLEKVRLKIPVVDKIVALIKNKQFDEIKNFLVVDTSLLKYNVDVLIANMEEAEPRFGNASEFIPVGFKFLRTDQGRDLLQIFGLIVRDKQNNNLSVLFDPNSPQEKIYMMNYKF